MLDFLNVIYVAKSRDRIHLRKINVNRQTLKTLSKNCAPEVACSYGNYTQKFPLALVPQLK